MIQICQKDKEKVFEAIRTGKIDAAEMSFPNLIDDILLVMKKRGLTAPLTQTLPDKRRDNSHIPFDILLCLAVAAKLKCKTSLTDVPFAVTEAELLAELGWNIWDNERDVNDGLFSESVMRKLLAKYKSEEWVSSITDCANSPFSSLKNITINEINLKLTAYAAFLIIVTCFFIFVYQRII